MNETIMTIAGNVVDDPYTKRTRNQHAITTFRVASTPRRFDRQLGKFVDDSTLFVNVTCWRGLAENVAASIRKGQPVVVSGRYYQREYELNEAKRIRYELEATVVGHDLTRGVTTFTRAQRPPITGLVDVDASGAPEDDGAAYADAIDRLEAAEALIATAFPGAEAEADHDAEAPLDRSTEDAGRLVNA